MENYLNENFGDVKAKNSSEEALQRWRNLCWLVKNRKRRFRFTANLSKRSEAEAIRRSNQLIAPEYVDCGHSGLFSNFNIRPQSQLLVNEFEEKFRVAVLVSHAALQFIHGLDLSTEYTAPDEVEAAGFQIDPDELGSIVEGHEIKKLKAHGGVESLADKLSTSITKGISASEDSLNQRRRIFGGDDETPLQVKLNGVATIIGKMGLCFAVVTFAVLVQGLFSRKLQEGTHWAWSGDDAMEINSKGTPNFGSAIPVSASRILLQSIFNNTGGEVVMSESNKTEILGTPTETAILEFGLQLGGDFQAEREASKIVKVEPFNSAKKRMGVVLELPEGGFRAHCKGASEIVLALCDKFINSNGEVVPLTEALVNHLNDTIEQFANEALRTLCLAYMDIGNKFSAEDAIPAKGYTCIGIVGIKDPVRPGVKESVAICRSAGINVRMVTGDNINTAKAIARECGILTDDGTAPLTAVQLLWVNMIMDTLGALALATEPPTDDLMKRTPVGRKGNFINNVMWRNILGQSLFQFLVVWHLQRSGKAAFHLDGPDSDLILNTLIFNTFVFCQVFNEISSREMEKINVFKGILKNYVFVFVLACTVFFQIVIIEFLGTFANTTPLTWQQWFVSILFGFLGMPIAAAVKLKMILISGSMFRLHFELAPKLLTSYQLSRSKGLPSLIADINVASSQSNLEVFERKDFRMILARIFH
ncbi:hypothetical protein EZV62_021698 [Acer yangbiense]|uniref:P-type Cu(+) transporter n=1 Tax=Acer yangbiense TaxID=1000413 RepID=A0A5C7H729_9ROSI|nr:hypothetical protein EZV62_021698 [Acer yangbiense]